MVPSGSVEEDPSKVTGWLTRTEVGALVKAGRKLRGVPTSEGSRRQAEALGIPLLADDGPWAIDVTVEAGPLLLDPVAHAAFINGTKIVLTPTEFRRTL